MNLNTERLEKIDFCEEPSDKEIRKNYQELYVLGFLRILDSEKYKNVVLKDRPDLQGDSIGIEVTLIDSERDRQNQGEFEKYIEKPNKRSENIIKNNGAEIKEYSFQNHIIRSLHSGGGWNAENDKKIIEAAIEKKIKKSRKFDGMYGELDIALLRTELTVSAWKNEIAGWIKGIMQSKTSEFKYIFVLYSSSCLVFDTDGNLIEQKDISIRDCKKLHILASETAVGRISLKDLEWN
ncbi:hypothetical protein [Pseudobutyrivibrio xylanivorans]|uniref:Uncharacterized protein n=1 Tax=Pseudobutyrivibrio xylanivorans TaxID=185007 RepID=A0A1G5RYQ0_PSEXY|nr:hypothetical protein [Pseudobutyrivibrio xylanivorans]SCZ79275.1 hypothetical protein SAMN02910350_01710 [Pseudobutyrivibrio xylanivorans]